MIDLTNPEAAKGLASDLTGLLGDMREAAIELAQVVSFAEIIGKIGHNREPIRNLCDRVFELKRLLEAEEMNAV
jgi:hypothetical protein